MQVGIIYSLTVSDRLSGRGWEINDLNMSFEVTKDSSSTTSQSNHATIRIWNLAREKQTLLERGKVQVILKVGYQQEGNLTYLFSGEAVSVNTRKEQADVITEIRVTPIFTELSDIHISHTIPAGKTVRDVINYIVSKVPSIKKVTAQGDFLSKTLPDGYSLMGNPYSLLKQLAKAYKLDWNIDNDTLFVADAGMSWELNVEKAYRINQLSGLVGRPYRSEDSAEQNSNSAGITFQCLLNPRIQAGGIIRLEYEGFTDYYKVDTVRFSGTSHSPSTWLCDVNCSRYRQDGNHRWSLLLRPDKTGAVNVSTGNIV